MMARATAGGWPTATRPAGLSLMKDASLIINQAELTPVGTGIAHLLIPLPSEIPRVVGLDRLHVSDNLIV
jgi:hypothetical protein